MKKVKNPQTVLDNLNNTMVDKYLEEKDNWYVGSTGNHQGLIISETDGKSIAIAYDKKDAPLIAAAPDMLEALKKVTEQLGIFLDELVTNNNSMNSAHSNALAAIAKATNNQ